MPRTIAQILEELNEMFEGEEGGKKVTDALMNSDVSVIKKVRSLSFASGKKDGQKDEKGLSEQLETANGKVTALTEEIEKLKKATPDLEATTKDLTEKSRKEIEKRDARIAELEGQVVGLGRESGMGQFIDLLTGEDLGVDKEYAREVLRTRHSDRFVVDKKTGKVTDVLKPGETTGYEADTVEEKVKLLAADVRKTVPTKFVTAKGDTGGGVRGNADGGGASAETRKQEVRSKVIATGDYGPF